MILDVAVRHNFGKFRLDAAFRSEGRLTALFGPSGCGKTSLINAIAGLLRPDEGTIAFDGETLMDTASGQWVPAYRRRIGYVFQDARLLPHFSVAQNLRYGQWFTPAAQRYADENAILGMLGITGLMDRKPRQLSGGERQRVALGRALLQSPRLLIMDEPLASLDEARKHEVLPFIEKLRDEMNIPIIYVSHSPAEVARLATDMVLMAAGRVVRAGPAHDILPALATLGEEFAQESGSVLDAIVERYDGDIDVTLLRSEAGPLTLSGRAGTPGQRQRLFIRANDIMVATRKPEGLSALNILEGRVTTLSENPGGGIDVSIQCGGAAITALITRQSARRLNLGSGDQAFAIIKAMSLKSSQAIEPHVARLRPSGKG